MSRWRASRRVRMSRLRDELHCRVVRGEMADAPKEACAGHAAVNSCGGEVNGGAGKADPMGSERSDAGQRQDGGQHVHPMLG